MRPMPIELLLELLSDLSGSLLAEKLHQDDTINLINSIKIHLATLHHLFRQVDGMCNRLRQEKNYFLSSFSLLSLAQSPLLLLAQATGWEKSEVRGEKFSRNHE